MHRLYLVIIVLLEFITIMCNCARVQANNANILALNIPGSVYIKPGHEVLVDMDVSNLLQPITSCQAFLNFSSTYFLTDSANVSIVPGGGGVWEELIWGQWNTQGDMDVAVGIKLDGPNATSENGTSAKITLKARSDIEGATNVVFRSDADPDLGLVGSTILGNVDGTEVWPTKLDSPVITIDGTAPNVAIISISQNGHEIIGSTDNIVSGVVNIKVTADDPVHGGVASGLAGQPTVTVKRSDGSFEEAVFVNENPAGVFNYTWNVIPATPNGVAVFNASVADRAGNIWSALVSSEVNKNKISGSIAMYTLQGRSYSFNRVVTFVATKANGDVLKVWNVNVCLVNNSSTKIASGDYILEDVPEMINYLSAKTNWSLRRRLPIMLGNNTATINFIGSSSILSGDLNSSNNINIFDYNILMSNWFKSSATADINGDGSVNIIDYNLMKTNWFRGGDAI